MIKFRFIADNALPDFLQFLSQKGRRVLVPTEKTGTKNSIVFEEWKAGQPWTLAKATVPPKFTVLPQSEVLLRYRKVKDQEQPDKINLLLEDQSVATLPETVIFACRSCDARGFAVLDRPYLKGIYADPYYKAKREKLTVLTLTCPNGCSTCFCHWVGGGPTTPEGSDILMTQIEGGYTLQPITTKGKELLEESSLSEVTPEQSEQTVVARKAAWASLIPAPDISNASKALEKCFAQTDFWAKQTDRCLSCGACTYFCPTCYCFNITDEGDGFNEEGGQRLRSWDNCMSSLFTREASGHNLRQMKALRMRNRVFHKFAGYPSVWGVYSCNGCGRCVSNCPVRLDIRAIVLAALAEATNSKIEES